MPNIMWCWRKNSVKPTAELADQLHILGLDFAHFRGLLIGNTFIGIARARKATAPEQADAVMESLDGRPHFPKNTVVFK